MPDKPKRRKNNKNKRKNKGQYHQNNNTSNATAKNKQTSIEQGDLKAHDGNTVPSEEVVEVITDNLKVLSPSTESAKTNYSETEELMSEIGISENERKHLLEKYKVESPEKPIKNKRKLKTEFKSKSLDNDNQPTIVEILDDIVNKHEPKEELLPVNTNNILITECEPDIEWEKADDLKDSILMENEYPAGALSITTMPHNIVECEEIKSMSPEEEKSLRQYLKSLNLSTNISDSDSLEAKAELEEIISNEIKQRSKNKGLAQGGFFSRPGPSRSLHVIDEEVSGESSVASRRHSYLNDKKSDNEELEDDVFYTAKDVKLKTCLSNKQKSCGNLIPQECIRVDAQIKDPDVTEAKGTWTTTTIEKMTGAEIVYLTDSSSSTSSIYDNNDTEENNDESDVSVRIITPTIEVVDTDNFLKNNFASASLKSGGDNKSKDIIIMKEPEDKQSCNTQEKAQLEIDGNSNLKENHEIVVLSTDTIHTDLYVKEIDTPFIENNSTPCTKTKEDIQNKTSELKVIDKYDLEMKVLKCELNVAINNLIKEVVSDSETTQDFQNDSFTRQDSSSSIGSSQCTAKYNPKCSSLNDVSGAEFDDIDKSNDCKLLDINNSRVKDVVENTEDFKFYRGIETNFLQIPSLRDICLETIYKLPYGEQILEELANVSERLQKMNDQTSSLINSTKHTYNNLDKNKVQNSIKKNISNDKHNIPPPVQPRQSSLKIICEDSISAIPKISETKRQCLSPSQKMLMEKLNTYVDKKTIYSLEENPKCIYKITTPDIAKENTFDIPFKSQTGSRLLALLRNPSITINSREQHLSEDNKKLGLSKSISSFYETSTKNAQNNTRNISEPSSNQSENDSNKHSNHFNPKPIPPPKPMKFSSSFYESDESSDFLENSFKSTKNHKQYFHFSTGNLNQDIEDDISCIQNMHRHFNDVYKQVREDIYPRRPSLPKDLTDRQMEYICRKEKEVEAEIYRLEKEQIRAAPKRGPRAPMLVDKESPNTSLTSLHRIRNSQSYGVLPSLINPDPGKLSSVFSKSQEELLRNKMYSEYVSQMAEREERKQKKIIKISKTPYSQKNNTYSKSTSELNIFDSQVNNHIEKEFIDKAKERWYKLGIKDPETEDESASNYYREPKVIEHKIKVIDSGEEKDVQKLPNHLQDFVMFTAKDKSDKIDTPAVWSPGVPPPPAADSGPSVATPTPTPPPPPPIWTPSNTAVSPQTQRKTFRPVHFEESPPTRRKFEKTEQNGCGSGAESESRLRTSQSAPATGLNSLDTSRLPKAQNPTVTLLQKAREGQLSRANNHQQQERDPRLPRDRPSPPFGDPVHALRRGYVSEGEGERREKQSVHKMAESPKKIDGIGPITKDGMPVTLRSEVKDPSRWYKKMYDTIHKNKYDNDYVTVRYKSRRDEPPRVSSSRSQYAYFDPRSGYLSEPEGGLSRLTSGTWSDAYDSDVTTGPRRRTASVQEGRSNDVTSPYLSNNKYSTLASTKVSKEVYKSPGKIENYTPGKSSVVDKEAKQWWDEVMDIFDGWLDDNSPLPPYSTLLARAIQKNQNISSTTSLPSKEKKDITSAILSKSNMARALKESGYESDSTLVFKRREDVEVPLSPAERRAAYRDLQAGGEPPLRGFRSPAPPRTEESEIEYIPISSTLTKIRVHKKSPSLHEVICFPVINIERNTSNKVIKKDSYEGIEQQMPPPPPRRISSRSSRTLQIVTSAKPRSVSPRRVTRMPSNIDLMKEKLNNKLNRQHTHLIVKETSRSSNAKYRKVSTSAPPALNRSKGLSSSTLKFKNMELGSKPNPGTSSFRSPRKTMLPTEYATPIRSKYEQSSSVIIEGGVGRKTPITNILDKVTPLDKLWGSQKRNERIDLSKLRVKNGQATENISKKPTNPSNKSSAIAGVRHKSRDMIRTSEKIQKLKSDTHTQSTPCLTNKRDDKPLKSTISNIFKSSSNIFGYSKKSANIKTAVINNNLKKKKSLETLVIKPKVGDCRDHCIKNKPNTLNKNIKNANSKRAHCIKDSESYYKEESLRQFGDALFELDNANNLLNTQEIRKTRDAIVSDYFFQHLFFRNVDLPILSTSTTNNISSVKEKAKFFQTHRSIDINHTPTALNTYLINRKPVSLSRFKIWDSNASPTRSQSPRSISWPGRMDGKIKKFESLVKCQNELEYSASLSTARSKSEPPKNKLYFTQTSRPKSPVVIFHKIINDCSNTRTSTQPISEIEYPKLQTISDPVSKKGPEVKLLKHPSRLPEKLIPLETDRSILDITSRQKQPELKLNSDYKEEELNTNNPSTMFFSQTSRPVSPKVVNKFICSKSRSHSTSPVSIRSPSYRRIYNTKLQNKTIIGESRPRSVDNLEKNKILPSLKSKSKSDTITHGSDPEYEEYIRDIETTKKRSERFRELNTYYSYLERVGELEKTTSKDLHHRRKDEDIIDFDRWKKIRIIERAEEELNNLYDKLKTAQSEKDFLFYPRDVKDFKWNFEKERGLKVKEKSVEDLKEDFIQKSSENPHDGQRTQSKDVYKPLWRGVSVAETAYGINQKNETENVNVNNSLGKPLTSKKDLSLSDLRKRIGIGNRLWSSLSLDQVNALKNQLNAIYSKELQSKSKKDMDNFTVEVKDNRDYTPNLHVRCASLTTSPAELYNLQELTKSDSIAAICPVSNEKDLKNNVNKIQMSLSENEKKKISQTLSKEVINRIKSESKNELQESLCKNVIKENNSHMDSKRHVVYSSDKEELKSSASETETGGSDVSNTTVIYVAPKKEVQKKVEYFESVKYHPHKNRAIQNENILATVMSRQNQPCLKSANQISQSQSCTNIKEFFGESEKNKFISLPTKPDLHSRSASPYSEVYISDRRTPDTVRFSSDETIWRSRSPSPDPERYWRTYLKLARAGEVRRLARRFDSPTAAGAVLRRHRSDPEINRIGLRHCLCTDKSLHHREKCRPSYYTVARVPLKSTNRFMPHIDIISKLASLRRRTGPRSRSAEEALECRPGEVERIRKRFEVMSLLGQIYTSAPDVSELRDIAPYLAGSWIAHRYPKPSDNNRSIDDSKTFVGGRLSPIRKEIKKPVSKECLKSNSILKIDPTEGQQFNPSVHRPISRYEPPRAPPRPPPAEWPFKLAPFVTASRHTVTFQETDSAPEPPRRMQHSSISDSESPSRRYVESDVNIHYRCPVRHDPLPLVPERELARQQAEHMKRLYREQKRNKYLQELQDMQSRRHQDNFMPSQKTIVPLNRYDEPERIIARALYTFNGQTSRELSFRKGDIINVRRQIDNNWYEGEIHGRIGLFPYNYVELLKGDVAQSPKKPVILEGRARAKFDFTAQTNLELPLKKGELVVLTRRVDHNWWEGRLGNKMGIFPDSYVTILQEPSQSKPDPQPILATDKPVASPAAHGLVNGDKRSLGAHSYTPQPNSAALANAPPATEPLRGYSVKTSHTAPSTERGHNNAGGVNLNNTEPLYVDTNAEAVPYRAMYKYRPQNPDELEMNEGDTVYVLEKCDDGWYVGSSQRTGRFGTFPGNYVERI